MKDQIKNATLILAAIIWAMLPGLAFSNPMLTVIARKRAALSGSSPAWYSPLADPLEATESPSGVAELEASQEVTVGQTGNATKVRLYISPWYATTNLKMCLFDNSGNLLDAGGTVSITSTGWFEVALTAPVAVTASTVYRVGWHIQTYGNASFKRKIVASGGGARTDYSGSAANYASFPVDPSRSADLSATRTWPAAIYVE